ncbi:glycerophosphoryl diester phosphodiesterase [Endozoicomonas arenosclerae]|uniref:glycerophosphoryl diester phosphodiesterase n=1 Tax=Endozoicomonas arenosclerae TaxID=1633495 RepID=UPI000782C86B|nr:glycerophosphoryl diester phosphodiesterase [Endozoicomonas arenosclerae]
MDSAIGHRGVAALAPENTLAGIQKAADLGLKWIELDVTLLGDGTSVMFHDPRINRTTSGRGHLKNNTLDQLSTLDAGSWFSSDFAGEKVPTLIEALTLIKKLNLSLNLELKPNRCDLKLLVEEVVAALEAAEFSDEQLLVSSFNHKALVLFRAKSGSRIGCLFESLPRNWKHKARQVDAKTIHVNARKLKEKKALEIKDAGYELYCYTVNDKVLADQLKDWGVDGVFTDNPGVLG